MVRSVVVVTCVSVLAVTLSQSAFSQGAPQTVTLMKVDPQTLGPATVFQRWSAAPSSTMLMRLSER